MNPHISVHPGEKALFALSTLIMVILGRSNMISLYAFLLMFLCISRFVPMKTLLALILIPFTFMFSGIIPILITFSRTPLGGGVLLIEGILYGRIDGLTIGKSVHILGISMAATGCFFFLILTTPIGQIDYLFERLHVPTLFREMFILIYRYIFILAQLASDIYKSMKLRSGFKNFRRAINSMGHLSAALIVKSTYFTHQSHLALQSRGYRDNLNLFQIPFQWKRKNIFYLILNICLLISLKGVTS